VAKVKSVGIRELKRSISGYLREVQSGERILVTDRKRPLAIISAVDNEQEYDELNDLVGRGIVYWTGEKPLGAAPRIRSKKSISDAVIEDRR
jgi:prevent-host-death family protein